MKEAWQQRNCFETSQFVVDRFQTGISRSVLTTLLQIHVEETAPPGVARALGDSRT